MQTKPIRLERWIEVQGRFDETSLRRSEDLPPHPDRCDPATVTLGYTKETDKTFKANIKRLFK